MKQGNIFHDQDQRHRLGNVSRNRRLTLDRLTSTFHTRGPKRISMRSAQHSLSFFSSTTLNIVHNTESLHQYLDECGHLTFSWEAIFQ